MRSTDSGRVKVGCDCKVLLVAKYDIALGMMNGGLSLPALLYLAAFADFALGEKLLVKKGSMNNGWSMWQHALILCGQNLYAASPFTIQPENQRVISRQIASHPVQYHSLKLICTQQAWVLT